MDSDICRPKNLEAIINIEQYIVKCPLVICENIKFIPMGNACKETLDEI